MAGIMKTMRTEEHEDENNDRYSSFEQNEDRRDAVLKMNTI